MATVTGLTAERMIEMENATVIDGNVVGDNLILITRDNTQINAGSVRGPMGPAGPTFVVCTSSTRPSYGSGDEGKAIYETDTKLIRVWTGSRFRLQEKVVCTSSTRPAMVSADEGVKIYETDTDLEYTWTGTSWLLANSYVAKYTSVSARSSAWPSPPEGALSYLTDAPGTLWVYQNGSWVSVGLPPGSISAWIGTVAPLNWVLMYGQTIENAQTLYPVLWSMIDPSWKLQGGPNMHVPDLRGRIPVGIDNMGGVASGRIPQGGSMGGSGGESYHTLTLNEVPPHRHTSEDGSPFATANAGAFYAGLTIATGGHQQTFTSWSGNGGSHNNMQPYILLNWILKIV